MKKYIMGNFKMNFDKKEMESYLADLKNELDGKETKNEIAIFPPFLFLLLANEKLKEMGAFLGAQNVNENESGAFTGEVSAKMLKSLFVEYVLVGHSERRKLFGETNHKINLKLKTLLKYGIKPVLCIGETENERMQGKTNEVLNIQILDALQGIYENELESIVIAYEPVWAIGTGKNASEKDVLEAVKHIRQTIKENFSQAASEKMIVLYGGSLKSSNAKNYLSHKEINGALVGGSSLNAQEFAKIIFEN